MSDSWNGVEFVKRSGEPISEKQIKDMLTNVRALPSDTILNINRVVYDALVDLYKDREEIFDIKTTGTVKDNVLYKNEVIIYE